MSSSGRRIADALAHAGWHRVRKQGQNSPHEVWRCPPECGQHQVSVPSGFHGADVSKNSSPILRRIHGCQKALLLRAAAATAAAAVAPPTARAVELEPASLVDVTPAPASAAAEAAEPEPSPTPSDGSTQTRRVRGTEVVAQEQAVGPHPHFGYKRLVPHAGISHLLLADGSEVYECDQCGHLGDSCASVRGHRSSAHRQTPVKPQTDEATIRRVLREVEIAKRAGTPDHVSAAADALNRMAIRPARSSAWTRGSVASIYQRYRGVYRIDIRSHEPKETNVTTTPRPGPPPQRTAQPGQPAAGDAQTTVAQVAAVLQGVAEQLSTAAQALASIQIPAAADPEVLQKAKAFDEMRRLMGGA